MLIYLGGLLVVAIIVVTARVYRTFANDLTDARNRLLDRSSVIATRFGTLEYALLGEAEPILTVHGAGGGFDQGIDIAGALAERGYRLIVPSRFGYLRSASTGNLTTAAQADAFAELLDRLALDKVVVVGISAGAWSAIRFAIRYAERCRALVLLVPADFLPIGTTIHGGALVRAIFNSDLVAWAALKLMPIMPGGMTRMILGTDPTVMRTADPTEKQRVQQVLDHLLPVSARLEGMKFDIATAASHDPYPVENIACPVLTISAEDDRFGTARRAQQIAARALDGKAIIFPTGGHALVGHHVDTLREITSFLEAVAQKRPPS